MLSFIFQTFSQFVMIFSELQNIGFLIQFDFQFFHNFLKPIFYMKLKFKLEKENQYSHYKLNLALNNFSDFFVFYEKFEMENQDLLFKHNLVFIGFQKFFNLIFNEKQKFKFRKRKSIFSFQTLTQFVIIFSEYLQPIFYVKQKFKLEKKNQYSLFNLLASS